jgi:hypothetical protein
VLFIDTTKLSSIKIAPPPVVDGEAMKLLYCSLSQVVAVFQTVFPGDFLRPREALDGGSWGRFY